jgi:hypothetical protein
MLRSITVTLAATVAVAFAACGSGEDTASSNVTTESAKAVVERAAHPEPIPDDAGEQGLRASYSNATTAVKDKQVVALFVMNDAGVGDKVSDIVRSSAPESARLIVNDKIMVVYAAAGSDHATAVENAIEAL